MYAKEDFSSFACIEGFSWLSSHKQHPTRIEAVVEQTMLPVLLSMRRMVANQPLVAKLQCWEPINQRHVLFNLPIPLIPT